MIHCRLLPTAPHYFFAELNNDTRKFSILMLLFGRWTPGLLTRLVKEVFD